MTFDKKMKSLLVALTAVMLGTSLPSFAEEKLPQVRIENGWIVVSYTRTHPQNGPLPWSHAIRKDVITSASIVSDFGAFYPDDGKPPKSFDGASEEEIANAPAIIEIITTELNHDGGSKKYEIHGLTHGTAPAFLQRLLDALSMNGK